MGLLLVVLEPDGEGDTVVNPVAAGDAEDADEADKLSVGEAEAETVSDARGLVLGLNEPVGVSVGDSEDDEDRVAWVLPDGLPVADGDNVADFEGVGEGLTDDESVGSGDCDVEPEA